MVFLSPYRNQKYERKSRIASLTLGPVITSVAVEISGTDDAPCKQCWCCSENSVLCRTERLNEMTARAADSHFTQTCMEKIYVIAKHTLPVSKASADFAQENRFDETKMASCRTLCITRFECVVCTVRLHQCEQPQVSNRSGRQLDQQ